VRTEIRNFYRKVAELTCRNKEQIGSLVGIRWLLKGEARGEHLQLGCCHHHHDYDDAICSKDPQRPLRMLQKKLALCTWEDLKTTLAQIKTVGV
jgi:hypothetical protein